MSVLGGVLDAARDLSEERVADVGDDQRPDARPGAQRARRARRLIAQLLDCAADAPGEARVNRRPVVEDARHGGRRDRRALRYLLDRRHPPTSLISVLTSRAALIPSGNRYLKRGRQAMDSSSISATIADSAVGYRFPLVRETAPRVGLMSFSDGRPFV